MHKVQGRRLCFSDAENDDDQVRPYTLSQVKLQQQRMKQKHQERMKRSPAAQKKIWDQKIRILMSMR